WLASMPFFHQAGLIRSRAIINAGGRNIILGRLSPAQLASAITKHKITVAMPMGRQLAALLSATPLPTSLRLLIGGGGIGAEAMSVIDKACAQLGCSWIGVYGQTETHGTITVVDLETAKANALTCGYPGKGVRLDIVDDQGALLPPDTTGEILVYGDMTGHYWNNDEANTALYTSDGGLRTGDLGYLNEEGWLHLRGRKKELIKTGGENVYPQEVERVLLEHPCVQDAAVIGLPDEEWGEAVVAIIVASEEARPSLEDFREFCRGELAGYKLPRRLCWVEELPRNHTGKVQTGLLRSRFNS
ncbi:MAG: AMP-binding protein, partial [Pseudomonadota bacterium]